MPKNKEYVTPPLPMGLKLVWEGIFDMPAVYKRMKYWLDFNGYGANFEEKEYSETIKNGAKEMRIMWYSEKAKTGYFAYVIEIKFLILGLKDAEIQKEDRKIKVNDGYFETRTAAYVLTNYQDKYKNKLTQNIYEKFIVKKRIDLHKGLLHEKVYSFQDEIRKLLTMY